MTNEELKPCPFCGCEAEIYYESPIEFGPRYSAYCLNCNAETDIFRSEEKAIEAWNKRQTPWIPVSKKIT